MKKAIEKTKTKFRERRRHWWITQFIIDMHSAESQTSWTRWMGTIIISNIMLMWTASCVFDSERNIVLTLEDMPMNLAGLIFGIILGKVGQSYVESKGAK